MQDAAALLVDDLPLAVQDLVVLQDVLAELEVLLLHLGLRRRDRAADHLRLDRHVLRDAEPGQHLLDDLGLEQAHQVVAEGQVEPGLARVALPAGPAAELVVDAAGLVPLGAEDVEAAELGDLVVLRRGAVLGRLRGRRPTPPRTPPESRTGSGPWPRAARWPGTRRCRRA